VSVGGAIGHAARRAPVYLGSVILIILGLLLLAVPIIAVLTAMGITVEEGTPPSGAAWAAILLFIVVAVFVGTRMLMTSSVASAENAGPVQILKRSWALTRGNTGRLLGFLLMFMVALVVVLSVIGVMIGLLSAALLGKAQPFSLAALLVGPGRCDRGRDSDLRGDAGPYLPAAGRRSCGRSVGAEQRRRLSLRPSVPGAAGSSGWRRCCRRS
jgi:hypothetical protein